MIHSRATATAPAVAGWLNGEVVERVRLASAGAVKFSVTATGELISNTMARAALRVVPIGPCGTSKNVNDGVTRLTTVSALSQRSVSTRSPAWRVTKPCLFHLPATKSSRATPRVHSTGELCPTTVTLLGRGTGHQ